MVGGSSAGADNSDLDSELIRTTESSGGSSSSDSESKAEILIPRSHRARSVRVIWACREVSDDNGAQPPAPVRSRPRPQIYNRPPESPDLEDSDPLEPGHADAVDSKSARDSA